MDDGITVQMNGHRLNLSWTWLRDHARDPASFDPRAQQRLVSPATVASAGPGNAALVSGELEVTWADGTIARFDDEFLQALGPAAEVVAVGPAPAPWLGDDLAARVVQVSAAAIDTDDGLRTAVDGLWRDGVITVYDAPTDTATTRRIIERFGYVRTTIFGDLWEFSSDGGFDDTASTPLEITPHTDGTYSHDAPGLLALHCHRYDATGGDNVFVDSHALAAALSAESRRVLRTIEIPGQYIGDGAHLMARRPVLRYEPGTDQLVQVSYNHHDRAPLLLAEPAMTELFSALREFDALANQPPRQFERSMRPGDMVIFDNWRVLHGRREFSGERHIAGGYVNREDFESTTRRLQ